MRNSSKRSPKTGRHASVRKKNRRVPSLRLHKASGQAYVVLNGKAVYCGKHGTTEAEQRYHQAIAEWLAAGRQLPAGPDITVKEQQPPGVKARVQSNCTGDCRRAGASRGPNARIRPCRALAAKR